MRFGRRLSKREDSKYLNVRRSSKLREESTDAVDTGGSVVRGSGREARKLARLLDERVQAEALGVLVLLHELANQLDLVGVLNDRLQGGAAGTVAQSGGTEWGSGRKAAHRVV